MTAPARFIKLVRRTDINLTTNSDDLELKDGSVDDFKYLKGTVHRNDVDGMVYGTARLVKETYSRREKFFVVYKRLVYTTSARGPEDKRYWTSKESLPKRIPVQMIKKTSVCKGLCHLYILRIMVRLSTSAPSKGSNSRLRMALMSLWMAFLLCRGVGCTVRHHGSF